MYVLINNFVIFFFKENIFYVLALSGCRFDVILTSRFRGGWGVVLLDGIQ